MSRGGSILGSCWCLFWARDIVMSLTDVAAGRRCFTRLSLSALLLLLLLVREEDETLLPRLTLLRFDIGD